MQRVRPFSEIEIKCKLQTIKSRSHDINEVRYTFSLLLERIFYLKLLLQIRNNSEKYSGFEIVITLVGANDLGTSQIEDVIEDLKELLCCLQDLNKGSAVYACEVSRVCGHVFKI